MKKLRTPFHWLVRLLICLSFIFFREANGTELSGRLSDPFALPQLGLYLGSAAYNVTLFNDRASSTSVLDAGGINIYGFDIEVPSASFLNIGGYLRVNSQKVETIQRMTSQFSTLLGGFTRFYYTPSFLKSNWMTGNIFARLELAGGPVFYGGPSGLVLQPGVHIGFETYFTKWFGLGLSYGRVFEYGKETFLSNDERLAYFPEDRDSKFSSTGEMWILTLKSTFY